MLLFLLFIIYQRLDKFLYNFKFSKISYLLKSISFNKNYNNFYYYVLKNIAIFFRT